ncbi:hypothetical protein OCA5_c18880 [Afipia carboxidovorans OM5]|uniref:Uncharacterized protein n=1 Tax=Afipia carboxidovorans (strain ATCC 49405 / DSM 1227 / KCTC 32145 / OM5) TaxID=504832 RepID=F8BUE8_AFIC5|nr:hypothetical protein [Afipia carboxidovorans]AEI03024.1 hypothetical protein OCA4_c18870 [Afipia carboxidovorans OM4]AEI06601.1 hypothetical protein OCA5_c18880 [Afipia carboxidovorans OM5]
MDTPFTPRNWYYVFEESQGQAFSSETQSYVPSDTVPQERLTKLARGTTMNDLITLFREQSVPPYHRIEKSIILSRLGDAKSELAFAIATVGQRLRWNAPDKPWVNADDPEMKAIIIAIGEDPTTVLAPA